MAIIKTPCDRLGTSTALGGARKRKEATIEYKPKAERAAPGVHQKVDRGACLTGFETQTELKRERWKSGLALEIRIAISSFTPPGARQRCVHLVG
jgi:hypothetical protein